MIPAALGGGRETADEDGEPQEPQAQVIGMFLLTMSQNNNILSLSNDDYL